MFPEPKLPKLPVFLLKTNGLFESINVKQNHVKAQDTSYEKCVRVPQHSQVA